MRDSQISAEGNLCSVRKGRAFTLIELLVVIAIIAILAAMLLPALARAKMQSYKSKDMSNLKDVQLAALMYKDDSQGYLLPNAPYTEPLSSTAKTWIDTPTQNDCEGWGALQGNTNLGLYTSNALLTPYIVNQISVYKCPADTVLSANGDRLRSYSMNGQMGAVYLLNDNEATQDKQYVKESDFLNPLPPSMAYIFCDEAPGSINDGYLEIGCSNSANLFPDVPASYLAGCCTFSFHDGHVEEHKWQTTCLTTLPDVAVRYNLSVNDCQVPGGTMNLDWQWYSHRAAGPN